MTIKQLVSHACTFALLAAPLAGAACTTDTPTGTLIVPFEIGAGVECSVASVVDVKISLFDMPPEGDASAEIDSLTVPCSAGEAIFNNLPVDRYYITAAGQDAQGFTVVDNDATETFGEVLAGKETTAARVGMFPSPARLRVRFALNKDMFPAMCSAVNIDRFKVTASKGGGLSPLVVASIPCAAVPDAADNYHPIPDALRQLEGATFDHIRVEPLDGTGNLTGSDIKYQLSAPPGPGRTVKITFTAECTNGACNLACQGNACNPD